MVAKLTDSVGIPQAIRDAWAAYEGNDAYNLADAVAIRRHKKWVAILFPEDEGFGGIDFVVAVDFTKGAKDPERFYWDVLNDSLGTYATIEEFLKDKEIDPFAKVKR